MSEYVAYTAIFGDSPDQLYEVPRYEDQPVDCRCRYICFTDRPQRVGTGWELRAPVWKGKTGRETARYHKLLSHKVLPDATYTVWMDASLTPKFNMASFAREVLKEQALVVWKHPQRVCIYQEAIACIRGGKDDVNVIRAQAARYLAQGYPYFHGLIESGVVARRNQLQAVREFNEAWWHELQTGSVRDQLSFNYVAWKQKFAYGLLPIGLNTGNSPWFTQRSHW